MNISPTQLNQLAAIAIEAARTAGRYITEAAQRPIKVEHKDSQLSLASQVVTEVDRKSQDIILGLLNPTLAPFDLALLTEETEDDHSRFEKDAFWCIDPLDGTLPFVEGQPGYSVSIALVGNDGTPLIGVVYDAVEGCLYHAVHGQGAFRNEKPWHLPEKKDVLTFVTDRSFKPNPNSPHILKQLETIALNLGLKGLATGLIGGAAMNGCWVLENAPACYFKQPKPQNGGGSLWDFAATACLFNEIGAVATDIFGQPLDLNRADSTFMNHRGAINATDQDLARQLMRHFQ